MTGRQNYTRDPSRHATEIVRAFNASIDAGADWDDALSKLRKKIQNAISAERAFSKRKMNR